ncbi:DUF3034 family protein [Zavarzinia aquatilis]|uniref:DUF3034 domain-containing protein n=1 Tax=Zavarzinia aquatilis TaxID=2211142 RepID=A0A317EDK0_9PROT|nr:DUF3034 family protein [Zavarzinia aquatilis]PWR24999.1 DUF3034 domain-containing protein [Zavarzinia aquatilis]
MSKFVTRLAGATALALPLLAGALPAHAGDLFDSARPTATGGVNTIEGAGGGGLAAWALITGYGSGEAIGGSAYTTFAKTDDYTLTSSGVAIGLFNRVELSFAQLGFDTEAVGGKLGIGKNKTFFTNIAGLKVRAFGDALDQEKWWLPQVAVGVQYKDSGQENILKAIGARDSSGVDYYLAASKAFLDWKLLVNGTLRLTKANQFGLLGFGGPGEDSYKLQPEISIEYLLTSNFVIGGEYRFKPDNLGFAKEDDWQDIHVAYFPVKNVSFTVAYVNAGSIANEDDQQGLYASLQVSF